MNSALLDLGLEYVINTDDYDALRAQIYEHYGVAEILGPCAKFDFPEPLCLDVYCHSALDAEFPRGKEQFFKHLLHQDAKALLPYVDAVLGAEHKNSPIHTASASLSIDRESIAQIVDMAYRLAGAAGAAPSSNAKALINMLVLTELLAWRT